MLARNLKDKLKRKELTLGPTMTFDFWAGYLEIYKRAGMDFVMVDFEHGSGGLSVLEEMCRTARLLDLPLILRSEASKYHLLRRYLDMGPAGFLIPWTEQEEQVNTVRDAVFCPPRGRRGPGGPSVFGAASWDRAGWDEVEKNLFVMLQIETPKGIESMKSLASHDWVDALMIGPYDLSLHLGHCGELDHPEVVEAITRILDQANQTGKSCGMPVGSVEMARFWRKRGCHFFLYSETVFMVRIMAERFVREMSESEKDKESKAEGGAEVL
ncbi:MAG TPA: aldolase/citrate lyase family protein [Terriglobia bacterium]|nr:aldolase/citrate lyase family protein [Terriglobia bacterium]